MILQQNIIQCQNKIVKQQLKQQELPIKAEVTPLQSPVNHQSVIKSKRNQRIQYIAAANTYSLTQQQCALVNSFEIPFSMKKAYTFGDEMSNELNEEKEINLSTQILRVVQNEDTTQNQAYTPIMDKSQIQYGDSQQLQSKSSDTAYFSPYQCFSEDQDALISTLSLLIPSTPKQYKKCDFKQNQSEYMSFAASALL